PASRTSVVGRKRELVEVKRALSMTRLLTLTGAGGCGKTRLALHVAAAMLDEYRGGVWFLELGSISQPSAVPQALAAMLGLRESRGRSLLDQIISFLQEKRCLLLLDNCEHLIDACAAVGRDLLSACRSLQILTTSRQRLAIEGEATFHLGSLSLSAEPNS
ncbi:MAG: ATP-binding protein, partial [Dehalococcoidia bacterium]